jgi:hypothetical protein
VSLAKATSTNVSKKGSLLSALPKNVAEPVTKRWSSVIGEFTDDQVSALYDPCCDENECNGAIIAFMLDYCDKLVPEPAPNEDGGSRWAMCTRQVVPLLLSHAQEQFPKLHEMLPPSYAMDTRLALKALSEWYGSIAYSVKNPDMRLGKLYLFVLIADPNLSVKYKAKVLCYFAGADSKTLWSYWVKQPEGVISEAFGNAMRGENHTLPITQPKIFGKAPCIKNRNCAPRDYLAELQGMTSVPLLNYFKKVNIGKLVVVMKKPRPALHDPENENQEKTHQDDYLIIEPTKDSWDELDRQLLVIDPKYIDQLFVSSPIRIQKLEPQIRERAKSLTDIDKLINGGMDHVCEHLFRTKEHRGHEMIFDEAFSTLLPPALFWVLHDIFEKCPKYLDFFYRVIGGNVIASQELEQFLARLQGVEDGVTESKIDRFVMAVARRQYPNHLLFKDNFKKALRFVRGHLYEIAHWGYNSELNSVIMGIDARNEQLGLRHLQVKMVSSKIHRSLPENLRDEFTSEPSLSDYKSWQLRMLMKHSRLWPLTYHPEMRLQEFIKEDKAPGLAQVLLHRYEEHHQEDASAQKTVFWKILNGIVERSKSWEEFSQDLAEVIFRLGSHFSFSVEPEESWKKFEEKLYNLDRERKECIQRIIAFAMGDAKLLATNIKLENYSNYADLFNAMVEAARAAEKAIIVSSSDEEETAKLRLGSNAKEEAIEVSSSDEEETAKLRSGDKVKEKAVEVGSGDKVKEKAVEVGSGDKVKEKAVEVGSGDKVKEKPVEVGSGDKVKEKAVEVGSGDKVKEKEEGKKCPMCVIF